MSQDNDGILDNVVEEALTLDSKDENDIAASSDDIPTLEEVEAASITFLDPEVRIGTRVLSPSFRRNGIDATSWLPSWDILSISFLRELGERVQCLSRCILMMMKRRR